MVSFCCEIIAEKWIMQLNPYLAFTVAKKHESSCGFFVKGTQFVHPAGVLVYQDNSRSGR
jgi:hypothetical protein